MPEIWLISFQILQSVLQRSTCVGGFHAEDPMQMFVGETYRFLWKISTHVWCLGCGKGNTYTSLAQYIMIYWYNNLSWVENNTSSNRINNTCMDNTAFCTRYMVTFIPSILVAMVCSAGLWLAERDVNISHVPVLSWERGVSPITEWGTPNLSCDQFRKNIERNPIILYCNNKNSLWNAY
jgi:hypothetical protein